jgi:predicted RNA-binding Zn ribbon-like protein
LGDYAVIMAAALPTWVPEIETKPAPMPLLLVQSFVNTYEADTGVDVLADLDTGRSWLTEAGLSDGVPLPVGELEAARDIRESIRALLVHNGGGDRPTAAQLEPLHALATTTRFRPVVDGEGLIDLHAEKEVASLRMADLILIVRDAQRDGSWKRLKACRNDECLWAFYDRSHAGRGTWCDMATCGNRIKNRNLRSRRSSLA